MKKNVIYIMLGAAAAGAMMLAGCKGQTAAAGGSANNGNTQVTVAPSSSESSKTITVEASESISLTPDMATLGIGVTNEAATIDEATAQNSEKVDAIVEFLRSIGYEDSSISTSDIGLYPQYDYSGSESVLKGYRMDTTIVINDVPADKVSEVLNGALDNGANTINSIRYFASGYDEAYNEALSKALKLAESKASSIAEASGIELSGLMSIEEHVPNTSARYSSTNGYMDYGMAREESTAAKASLDMAVLPGTVDAEASVTVVYEIK